MCDFSVSPMSKSIFILFWGTSTLGLLGDWDRGLYLKLDQGFQGSCELLINNSIYTYISVTTLEDR